MCATVPEGLCQLDNGRDSWDGKDAWDGHGSPPDHKGGRKFVQ
jgi:hypothetical protein